jgi:hypothetical protein
MHNPSKTIPICITILVATILCIFILPVLLLTKTIPAPPDAPLAHLFLLVSFPVTASTVLFQLLYLKRGYKRIRQIDDPVMKKERLQHLLTVGMEITLIAIVPNFVFLSLTNLDLFLFLNIMLTLWMIYLFPYPEKVKNLAQKPS